MNFAQNLVRWRWLWTSFTLLSMLLLAYGAKNLTFQSDYKIFFSKDNPQLTAYQNIEETFTHTDGIAFLISHADMTVLQKPLLEIQQQITADAWQMPFSRRVDSINNYQHTEVDGDELTTRPLVEEAEHLTAEQLAQIREIALSSDEILHWLISPDEKIAVVSVSLLFPENAAEKQQAAKTIMASANAIVQKYENQLPGLKVQLMGVAAYNGTFVALTEQDA
ncbi:MAG: MMPL family transporter, partial [Oceanospirillaceae bacterium]|nr:MMPL family transporter [Oceanospirillaceae bacterium]